MDDTQTSYGVVGKKIHDVRGTLATKYNTKISNENTNRGEGTWVHTRPNSK